MTLILRWNGLNDNGQTLDVGVAVAVEVKHDSPLTYWTIEITNRSGITLETINFPQISGIGQISQSGMDDFLVYPSMSGLLFQDPLNNFVVGSGWGYQQYYPSAYATMQFAAYYGKNPNIGLFVASHDTNANSKFLTVSKVDDWLAINFSSIPPFLSGSDFQSRQPFVVGIFSGDWYDAAQIYRTWAIKQPWTSKGLLSRRNDIPSWYFTIGLRQHVASHPCASQYSSLGDAWPQAQAYACLDRYGRANFQPYPFKDCGPTPEALLHKMCPATDFWKTELQFLLDTLAQQDADIIHLDGWPVFGPQPCMGTNHGHPQGGGNWWTSAYWTLLDEVKSRARRSNPDFAYTTEGMAEFYLPLVDSFEDSFVTSWCPSLQTTVQDPLKVELIPLWQVVYHDYALIEAYLSFVSRTGPRGELGYGDARDFFVRAFGLSLVWGGMPAFWYCDEKVSELNEAEERGMAAFLKRIVQARLTYAKPYLVYGRMLRPLGLNVPPFGIPPSSLMHYWNVNCCGFDVPSVLNSSWRTPSGRLGYVFCNISHDRQTFLLSISPGDASLPPSTVCSIFENRNGISTNRASRVLLPSELLVEINPLDVLLIEVVPHAPSLRAENVVTNGTSLPNLAAVGDLLGATWILERTTALPHGAWVELSSFAGNRTNFFDYEATNYSTVFYRLKLTQ